MVVGPEPGDSANPLSNCRNRLTHRADGKQISVLVVDQDDVLAEMVAMVLRYEGWATSTAPNGATAIAMARDVTPDVVVLDMTLPDMTGLDVLLKMRAQNPAAPLLLLTAKHSVQGRIAGLTAGGNEYVTKPFSLEDLVLKVRALLRHAGIVAASGSQLVVGDLILDEESHEVSRADVPISLTAREFELLCYLMRNSKRVQSKAQILDRVWSYDYGGRANVVELYVSYLRRKVDGAGKPMIHTLRGVGYILKPAG